MPRAASKLRSNNPSRVTTFLSYSFLFILKAQTKIWRRLNELYRFVTVHNVFINPIVNLNTLCTSCVQIACCLPELNFSLLFADSRIQTAIEQSVSCIYLSFLQFSLFPESTNKNLTEIEWVLQICYSSQCFPSFPKSHSQPQYAF